MIASIGAMLVGAVASTAAAKRAAADPAMDERLLEDHRVALPDGRRLNLICGGHGGVTLLFLQGAGSQMRDWSAVSTPAAHLARTCFYDRAGYGFSDPPSGPMTLSTVVDDLRSLLKAAGERPPYILVGHSIGGFYATYYADRFPQEVAGLVLVDPAFAGMFEFPRTKADELAFATVVDGTFTAALNCLSLARVGRLTTAEPHGCLPFPPPKTPRQRAFAEQLATPGLYEAEFLEIEASAPIGRATPPDAAEERAAARSFGALPLAVLTAGTPPSLPGLSAEAGNAYAEGWRRGHDALAARSIRGTSTVVPQASHFIQLDHPQAVLEQISRVLTQARATPSSKP